MTTTAPGPAALAILEMAQSGRFAEIRELFAPQLRPLVPADALQAAWDGRDQPGRRGDIGRARR